MSTDQLVRSVLVNGAVTDGHLVVWDGAVGALVPGPLTVKDGGSPGGGSLTVLTADPASPADDTFWVRRTGVSPAMDVELRVRIAGVTYSVAGITI